MKSILIVVFFIFSYNTWAQTESYLAGPLTSGKAPSFSATSTMGLINFPADYFGKWKILFSHPSAFTPVCTSEIIALAQKQEEFKKLKTQLVVFSTDGLNSHMEWVKSIESIEYDGFTPVTIDFPLVSDTEFTISKRYGLLQGGKDATLNIRGVVFIDPDDKIRAFFHYPNSIGRNVDEIIRTLIALQTQDRYNVLTPADWQPGEEVLIESPGSREEAEKLERKKRGNLRKVTWYMWYRRL
jgi:peroxiredoxin 2/4